MNRLISIIMPVYNAERYISECIQSVLAQSYTDWELIAVDDGSTDSSPEIIDKYSQIDSRVIVVHKAHEGVSEARNVGLNIVRGDYIAFLDADDRLTIDSLKYRIDCITDSQMVIANYRIIGDNHLSFCTDETWDKDTAIKSLFKVEKYGYQGYLWNKLFVTNIVKKHCLSFQRGIVYNEDRLFCYSYFQQIKQATISNEVVYEYRRNIDSVMGRINILKDAEINDLMTEFEAFDKMVSINTDYIGLILWAKSICAVLRYNQVDSGAEQTKRTLKSIARRSGTLCLKSKKELGLLYRIKLIYHITLMK